MKLTYVKLLKRSGPFKNIDNLEYLKILNVVEILIDQMGIVAKLKNIHNCPDYEESDEISIQSELNYQKFNQQLCNDL